MHAWIAAGLSVICWGAAPAPVGNQPRPQVAKPAPHGVIGVVYTFPSESDDECQASTSSGPFDILLVKDEEGPLDFDLTISIPPSPLPERMDECVQVFAGLPPSPESCHDSDGHPPAPPVETSHCVPAVMPPHPALTTPAGIFAGQKIRLFRNDHTSDAFPFPIVQKLGAEAFEAAVDEPRPIPALLTKDRVQHVQAAIRHLEAAGLNDAARRLREQSREAVAVLRQEQRRRLQEKEDALLRLSEEIEQLKADLASDAAIEFRLEHFAVNSALLTHVTRAGHAELRAAARVLSASLNPTLRVASKLPPHPDQSTSKTMPLATAIHILQDAGVIELRSAPRLMTRSGETVHLVVGNGAEAKDQAGTRHLTHTNFAVHEPVILPDGRIQAEVNYEIATEEKVVEASGGKGSPSAENMKVVHQVQLTSGQTEILGGISANGRARGVTGVSHQRRVEVITITATLTEIEAIPDYVSETDNDPDWINSAEADDCDAETSEIQPSSNPAPLPGRAKVTHRDVSPIQPAAAPLPPQYAPVPVLQEAPVFQLIPSPGAHGRMRLMVPVTPLWSPSFVPIPPAPSENDEALPAAPIPDRTDAEEESDRPPVA